MASFFRRLFGLGGPSAAETAAERAAYQSRLESPRWEEVEAGLGRPVPAVLLELYAQRELIHDGDLYVFPPDKPRKSDHAWYINQFVPADRSALQPELESIPPGSFNFASNEFGDPYYVELSAGPDGDGPVSVHYHDGGDVEQVATSLRTFLSWPREPRSSRAAT
jgi:hypothetical protein